MKCLLVCVLILESVGNSISVDKREVGNDITPSRSTENSLFPTEIVDIHQPSIVLDINNTAKQTPSTSSTKFGELPIHEYEVHRTKVQPAFLKRRSGIVENPPWIRNNGENVADAGQPPPLEPSPEAISRIALTEATIESESYCESIYEATVVEKLLFLDTQIDRPGGNWWKLFGSIFKDGGINVLRPMCASFPLNRTTIFNSRISAHLFFQSRGIDIPFARGRHGFRMVQFLTMADENPVKRDVLECHCEILLKNRDTNNDIPPVQGNDDGGPNDICVQGKIVSLSRGVGGNQSFFVYKWNPSSGFLNVIAHICFNWGSETK